MGECNNKNDGDMEYTMIHWGEKHFYTVNKLEMLGIIVLHLAHYDACVNLSTLCKSGIFGKEHAKQK